MKIISLRIGEEEKVRLEQLAEAGDITLSRALREGAALYLKEFQGKLHTARGGNVTYWDIRRDKQGRPLSKRSEPTRGELRRVRTLRAALYGRGFLSVREAWESGAAPTIVLASLASWLDLVGEVYVGQGNYIGWDWFLRDYCEGYEEPGAREEVRRELEGSLMRGATRLNMQTALGSIEAGFLRLLDDAENQELVRRAVLPRWEVLERRLSA
jgi:hypothetical protein